MTRKASQKGQQNKSLTVTETPPPHWPPNLRYITSLQYHTSVPHEIIAQLKLPPNGHNDRADDISTPKVKRPKVVIRKISNSSHPANGQLGLFAAQKIPSKTHILDYIGEIHCDERPQSDYDLSLCRFPDGTSVGIDASIMGNEARFVNDYRGISNRENAVFLDRRTSSGVLTIGVWSSSEDIKKGDEILVSYGKSWWRSRTETQNKEETNH